MPAGSDVKLSFDTSAIPDGATILSATLRLRRGTLSGTNPFTTHGTCWGEGARRVGVDALVVAIEIVLCQRVANVRQQSVEHLPAAVDWPSVEHLDEQLETAVAEEPRGTAVGGQRYGRTYAMAALKALPLDVGTEAAVAEVEGVRSFDARPCGEG